MEIYIVSKKVEETRAREKEAVARVQRESCTRVHVHAVDSVTKYETIRGTHPT